MASASRKARKTFSGLVARTRCKRTVLPSGMTLFSPLLSGVFRRVGGGSVVHATRTPGLPASRHGAKKNFRHGCAPVPFRYLCEGGQTSGSIPRAIGKPASLRRRDATLHGVVFAILCLGPAVYRRRVSALRPGHELSANRFDSV